MMKKTATSIRCVPRLGCENTEVRTINIDLPEDFEPEQLHAWLDTWFRQQGIADAVYDVDVADDGFFAIINDEVYQHDWGTPLL